MSDNITFVTVPGDFVTEECACPKCDEARMDWLVWDTDKAGMVTCGSCGMIYDPAVTDEIWEEDV